MLMLLMAIRRKASEPASGIPSPVQPAAAGEWTAKAAALAPYGDRERGSALRAGGYTSNVVDSCGNRRWAYEPAGLACEPADDAGGNSPRRPVGLGSVVV